ncbi:MAG: hypothetical protein ACREKE_06060 [bacterium]
MGGPEESGTELLLHGLIVKRPARETIGGPGPSPAGRRGERGLR